MTVQINTLINYINRFLLLKYETSIESITIKLIHFKMNKHLMAWGLLSQNKNWNDKCQVPTPLTTLLQSSSSASVSMFFILIIDEVKQTGWLPSKTHRWKSCIVFLFLAWHPSGLIKGVQPDILSKVSAWNIWAVSYSLRSAAIVLTGLRGSS